MLFFSKSFCSFYHVINKISFILHQVNKESFAKYKPLVTENTQYLQSYFTRSLDGFVVYSNSMLIEAVENCSELFCNKLLSSLVS